jgi:hypothetical protein
VPNLKALLLLLFLAVGVLGAPALALAQVPAGGYSANPNTPFNYGSNEEQNLSGVGKDIFSGMMSLLSSFTFNSAVVKILDWISNIFVLAMKYFWTLVGAILIRNIDFTSAQSFLNQLGFQTVSNLYTLFVTVGVCLSLSFFFLHIGQNAIGLGRVEIRYRSLIRLMVAISVLIFIPMFTSFMALWTNSLSQLIYQQNLMSMNGALDGISSLEPSAFSQNIPTQPAAAPVDSTSYTNVHNGILSFLNVTYFFAFVGCIVGMAVGAFKISANAQNGIKIFAGAALGLIFILISFQVTRYYFSAGASIFGSTPGQISSTQAYNGSTFTVPQAQSFSTLNTDTSGFWGGVQSVFNSTISQEASMGLELLAVIVKIFVSIFGCWIICKVFFGKIFQLLMLAALFILSPLLAASIAHPALENIAATGLKYIVKYYLYSVVWAIALVFMFIITSINFGFSNLGAQNFETALAMLGGLIFLEKVEGLVGLLTGTGGPSVEGAMRDFGTISQTMLTGASAAFGGAAGAITAAKAGKIGDSFGTHHMAGAVAGGALGFMAPILGAGKTAGLGATAGINLAHAMGNMMPGSGGSTPNPYNSTGSSASDPNTDLSNSLNNLTNTLQTRASAKKPPSNPRS